MFSRLSFALPLSGILSGAILFAAALPAFAGSLETAQSQYDTGNFKGAAATIRAGMYKGESSASAWLLLAKSYSKLGEAGACKQTAAIIFKHFPGSAEAKEAEKLVGSSVTPSPAPAALPQVVAPKGAAFEDRIIIVPPRFGHARVDPRTVGIVRRIIVMLPPGMYKILDKGGAQVFVTPNLIDKFPEGVQLKHPTLGHYLSEEFGRTYGKDAYICERVSSDPGSTELQAPLHEETIRATTYTQLSHALDTCLENPSRDGQYMKLYRQDVADAEGSAPSELKLYMSKDENGAKETFSGLAAGMMGANTQITRMLDSSFPRARAWIKARVSMLDSK